MDIIVTCPKSEAKHFWKKNPYEYEFWNLARCPTKLKPDDYIWFVLNGFCVARAKVLGFDENDLAHCETTGRIWSGCQVEWYDKDFEKLKNPFPYKGFQGFRYFKQPES